MLNPMKLKHIFSVLLIALILSSTGIVAGNCNALGRAQSNRVQQAAPLQQDSGDALGRAQQAAPLPNDTNGYVRVLPAAPAGFGAQSFVPLQSDFGYYPWLEGPDRKVDMSPDSFPPNQGTDDYQIIFHAIGHEVDSYLGSALVLAGDQNEDGYDDIMAYCHNPNEVRLYFGGNPMDTIPDFTIPVADGWGGFFPIELGDLNGDGDTDLVFAWEETSNDPSEVYIYYGGDLLDDQVDKTLVSDLGSWVSDDGFGYGLSIGDVNGNGLIDLCVGAPNYYLPGGG